jgi:hypothetical protein
MKTCLDSPEFVGENQIPYCLHFVFRCSEKRCTEEIFRGDVQHESLSVARLILFLKNSKES